MITTIQLHEDVKKALDRLRETRESYEEVIVRLLQYIEQQKRQQKALLVEGYREMAQESRRVTREWRIADRGWE